jgi:hypothetical protein
VRVSTLTALGRTGKIYEDQAPMRNVDSKIHSPRFDHCAFLFYSLFAATFSAASVSKAARTRCGTITGVSLTPCNRNSADIVDHPKAGG